MSVPAGTYTVTATAFGYNPATAPGVVITSGATKTQNFALSLVPPGTLTGHVQDATTNAPIANALVTLNPDTPCAPAAVVNVKPGGKETTNCAATDLPHEDTHIELVLGPSDSAKSRRVIVEVTPRWRAAMQAQGVDWSTDQLKASIEGHWVKVRGWLFFDAQHKGQSENTAPGKPGDWRATAWEIHPVTSIQVVPGP